MITLDSPYTASVHRVLDILQGAPRPLEEQALNPTPEQAHNFNPPQPRTQPETSSLQNYQFGVPSIVVT